MEGASMARPPLPGYSQNRVRPSRDLPSELKALEDQPHFRQQSDRIQQQLLKAPTRPSDDARIFVTLATHGSNSVTVNLPRGGSGLPVFSTPFRAADYADVHL